jgi:hypothetical protein
MRIALGSDLRGPWVRRVVIDREACGEHNLARESLELRALFTMSELRDAAPR